MHYCVFYNILWCVVAWLSFLAQLVVAQRVKQEPSLLAKQNLQQRGGFLFCEFWGKSQALLHNFPFNVFYISLSPLFFCILLALEMRR